jgi:predicted HAD superfamily Cof-like phosphohydrolase
MNNLESKIAQAYEKYGLAYDGPPRLFSLEEKNYRIACMFEEIEEYAEADTLVDSYDACIDLIVFAVGTLYRMGMPLQEGFDAVMKANLAKQPGNNPHKKDKARAEYRGTDLVKPEGWTPPEDELTAILINHSAWKKDSEFQRSIANPVAMPLS